MNDGSPTVRGTPPTIDRLAVRRTFARSGDGHRTFARAMTIARDALLHRLDDIRIVPDRILDLGAGTGTAAPELARRFPRAELLLVDPVVPLLQLARSRATDRRGRAAVCCGRGGESRLGVEHRGSGAVEPGHALVRPHRSRAGGVHARTATGWPAAPDHARPPTP